MGNCASNGKEARRQARNEYVEASRFVASAMEPSKGGVHQDMNRPLSHYFINSSHNTYLNGGACPGVSLPWCACPRRPC